MRPVVPTAGQLRPLTRNTSTAYYYCPTSRSNLSRNACTHNGPVATSLPPLVLYLLQGHWWKGKAAKLLDVDNGDDEDEDDASNEGPRNKLVKDNDNVRNGLPVSSPMAATEARMTTMASVISQGGRAPWESMPRGWRIQGRGLL